jgi:hypothetical protein
VKKRDPNEDLESKDENGDVSQSSYPVFPMHVDEKDRKL